GTNRPLGASRVLYEIGTVGADLRELRERLGLDSGYLSRIVQSLENEGLVTTRATDGDERVRHAKLTRRGRSEFNEMNKRADAIAESILTPLTLRQRERLVTAMDEVHRLLRVGAAHIERV